MFRKRSKKAAKNLRRKRNDEEDKEGGGEDDEATGIAIRKTIKKHKILASLPLTSAGTASNANKSNGKANIAEQVPPPPELSVLQTKHKSNMESFIEQQLAAARSKDQALDGNNKNATNLGDENTGESTHIDTTEEGLYQQLAREVTDAGDIHDNISDQKNQPQEPQQDGDQGDGGAALLVGTGIAEVILPATNHRPVTVPTNSRVWNKNSSALSSAVPEEERHKHKLPTTTPKPFVKFRKTNNTFTQNSDDNPSRSHNDSSTNGPTAQDSHERTLSSSGTARKGFDAFRGRISTDSNDPESSDRDRHPHQSNRIKVGKDRDDQVYSHFLKNALNGKNRR